MHQARAWCTCRDACRDRTLAGSFEVGGGENVPGVPCVCTTRNFVRFFLVRGPCTVYSKKYAHSFCFAVLCCGYTLTDFPISIRLTSLALWQSNDCPSASKATLMNMDEYFMWIHYGRLQSKAQQHCVHISWDILYSIPPKYTYGSHFVAFDVYRERPFPKILNNSFFSTGTIIVRLSRCQGIGNMD